MTNKTYMAIIAMLAVTNLILWGGFIRFEPIVGL